jgi:hypothetical protein
LNEYRCKTCKKDKTEECPAWVCEKYMINLVGCASHSDFQSRDAVLDEVQEKIINFVPYSKRDPEFMLKFEIIEKITELRHKVVDGA